MHLWWDGPPIVLSPTDAPTIISINHRKEFTTKRKFPTLNDLLEWV